MITIGRVSVTGLKETVAALQELPRATARNVLRRALMKRAEPLVSLMRSYAPDDPSTSGKHDLRTNIAVGQRLSPRQARLHRRETKDEKQFAEVFVGVTTMARQGLLMEFGTEHSAPQPFVRPGWDQGAGDVLQGLSSDIWQEIDKAARRRAVKLARLAGS